MKQLLLIFFISFLFSCEKEEKPAIEYQYITEVYIKCSRNFPVSLDGVDKGNCGNGLRIKVENKGAVLEIVPDILYLNPDGRPTGATTTGTAEITYNKKTSTKYISGNGVQIIINW